MSKIISIGTSVPPYHHLQSDILKFMEQVYRPENGDLRKLQFLYRHSGIDNRYSILPEFSLEKRDEILYLQSGKEASFPSLEKRMEYYHRFAAELSLSSIQCCLKQLEENVTPTHLISVSCTGMSAPGLDLELMEALNLPANTTRLSVNFMGCYAAVHALKMADAICKNDPKAIVLIVCTEICTIHFQKEPTADNIASSLLFGDGSAAIVVVNDKDHRTGLTIKDFYSEVQFKGKKDMSWNLSSNGFLMTLSGNVPELIEEDFDNFLSRAFNQYNLQLEDISHWCLHPGGKRILDKIENKLQFKNGELASSRKVLRDFGNMSSPTILFVLKEIWKDIENRADRQHQGENIFGAAFGPGLTMETFLMTADA